MLPARSLIAHLLALGAASRALAQAETEATEDVVVRGEALPRSASESVADRELIDAAPHRSASDALLLVPGLFVSQHSGEGKAHQIFYRGFDAVHGQDLEIWAGGAPVNDVSNLHGQGYADLHFVMPEVIERVRALPGSYAPEQGDFAVAGSLSLELGYDEPGITAQASAGSFGTQRLFLAYRPRSSTSATFGAVELYSTDGFGENRAARRASALAQVEHQLDGGVLSRVLVGSYSGRYDSAGVLRLEDVESGALGPYDTYDARQGGASSRHQLVLELLQQREPERWSLAPYVVLRSMKLRSNFTGYLRSDEGDSLQQLNDALTFGARASYRRRLHLLSSHDTLTAGLATRVDAIEQSQHRLSSSTDRVTDDALSPGIDAEVRQSSIAGYFDAELHPVRRVTLRGGVRGDGFAATTAERGAGGGPARTSQDALLSLRGSADFYVRPELVVTGSYGEGFRSPQARSLSEGEAAPFTEVRSIELGARYAESDRLSGSLALFRTALSRDLLFDHATGRYESVPATERLGVVANLGARWLDRFVSGTSFTYAQASFQESAGRYEAGDAVPYVPEIVARSDLAYEQAVARAAGRDLVARVGYGLSYLGRRPLPYSEVGHDVFLVDASAGLRLREVSLELEVFNVFDAFHYDGEFVYASSFRRGAAPPLVPARHVTVGPPRLVLLTLRLFI